MPNAKEMEMSGAGEVGEPLRKAQELELRFTRSQPSFSP
jgi:hypothetical protein